MRRSVGMCCAAILLAGCAAKQDLKIAVPGVALPTAGRVMLLVSQTELERPFEYNLNQVTKETTDISDGKAMADSAQAILTQVFRQVEVNKPEIHPHFVIRPQGVAKWDRAGGRYHVTCRLDAYNGSGDPIGIFAAAAVPPPRLGDFKETLPQAYADCLKDAAQKFAAAPEFKALADAGFPDPNPAAQRSYLRALGFTVR